MRSGCVNCRWPHHGGRPSSGRGPGEIQVFKGKRPALMHPPLQACAEQSSALPLESVPLKLEGVSRNWRPNRIAPAPMRVAAAGNGVSKSGTRGRKMVWAAKASCGSGTGGDVA